MGGIVALATLAVASPAFGVFADARQPVNGTTLGAIDAESAVSIGFCVAAILILVLLWWKDVIRPGSLGRAGDRNSRRGAGAGGRRDPFGLPAVIWLIGAALMYASPMFGATLALSLPPGILGTRGSTRHDAIIALGGYGFAIVCAAFLLYLLIPRAPAAGLRFRWKDILVGTGAFLLAFPVVVATGFIAGEIATWVHGAPPDRIAHSTLDQILSNRSDPWIIAIVAAATIGAPIHEEIVFRIFLQSALVYLFISRWAAVICTGVLFALVHRMGTDPVPWHAIAPIFVLGTACGAAYERTARPGVPIVMHALFNAVNVAIVLAS